MVSHRLNGAPSVAFDDQIFLMQRMGGISRYFVQLIRNFRQLGIADVNFPFRYARSHLGSAYLGMRRLPERPARFTVPASFLLNTPARSRLESAEVVHRTFYHPRFLGRNAGSIRAYTVYDMIPERLPEFFPEGNPHLSKHEHLREADLIMCISESTRRDLLELYPDLSACVAVTPLGVSHEVFNTNFDSPESKRRFVLFVGARGGYKDFLVLAHAVSELDDVSLEIVAVGGGKLSARERDALASLGLLHRTRQVDATDEELQRLYSLALAFVYPSRYEGFGLPTLEAMASGCPAILADSSSHPEVGGSAALYFPPQDSTSLARQLAAVIYSPDLREDMVEAGISRARGFTWQETAIRTVAAYREAIQGRA